MILKLNAYVNPLTFVRLVHNIYENVSFYTFLLKDKVRELKSKNLISLNKTPSLNYGEYEV